VCGCVAAVGRILSTRQAGRDSLGSWSKPVILGISSRLFFIRGETGKKVEAWPAGRSREQVGRGRSTHDRIFSSFLEGGEDMRGGDLGGGEQRVR